MPKGSLRGLQRILALILLLLSSGCATTDTAEGRALYGQYCASCHGANGEGQADWQRPDANGNLSAPPHDDSGHTWHHSDEQLFAVISKGRNAMPAYGDILSPAEQEAIVAYIKSLWSPEIRAAQEGLN